IPLFDETSLATPPAAPDPPAVAVYDVNNALPIVRTEQAATPVIVAGDGEGLVDLAATGLLNGRPVDAAPILYSAALSSQPSTMQSALAAGADLVLTDTNRKRGQRWGTTQYNNGYTEAAGETPLTYDPTDNRLPVFPGASDNAYTVAQQRGVAGVRATAFGDPVAYAPGERPDLALDGDPTTAWKAGAFTDVKGDRLRIDLSGPVTTDHINLVQTLVQARERYITRATLTFDGGHPMTVDLNQQSRTVAGQDVHFSQRTFTRVDITVDAMNFGQRADYRGGSPVGFAEVRIPGVQVDEVIRPPADLLQAAGPGSISHRLVVVFTRMRSNALASYTTDEEQSIVRTFSLPAGRTFAFSGTARLSASGAADATPPPGNDPLGPELVDTAKMDGLIDTNLGLAAPSAGGATAQSSERLPGDLNARAAAAIDGDPTTAWTTAFGDQTGKWIQATAPAPTTFDHLDLQVVADGRHSVPTRLRISTSSGNTPAQSVDVAVPPIADLAQPDATAPVRIALPHPLSGTTVRVTVLSVREERTINYLSATPQTEPIAIAELGIAGITQPPATGAMPATCRTDLLTIDGQPVGLRISGSRADALARKPLTVSLCGQPLALGPGDHVVRAVAGAKDGIDLDRLVFGSDRGGAALDLTTTTLGAAGPGAPAAPGTPAVSATPAPRIVEQGRTSMTLSVDHVVAGQPFWLVLGQSHNNGWTASASGAGSLGQPALVDGYANGWLVRPTRSGLLTVHLDWTPQRRVWIALGLSALAILLCLALVFVRRGNDGPLDTGAPPDPAERFTTLPALPALASPLRPTGRPLEPMTRLVTAVVGTVLGMLVIGPVAGLIMGAVLAVAVSRPKLRALLSLGSVALLAVSALYVIELQWRYHFPPKIEWPEHFHRITLIPWIAAAWLIADAVIEHLR
ncbi:MAG TPA: discoidin domain-containing protein, partial [Acidimicrobiales bacterium]|nr:discoidin domain-containing protein [Acidimicrobiales bacterium]